jgi:acyl carrier protein
MHAENSHPPSQRFNDTESTSPKAPSAQAIADWLIAEVVQRFGVDLNVINAEQPLMRFGLDSIAALELLAALEDWLNCSLPLTLMWDYPSIDAMAQHVSRQLNRPNSSLDDDIQAWIASDEQPQSALQWGGVHEHSISYGQRALWSLFQSAPDHTMCNLMSAVRIFAELDVPALQWAFQQLVDRHPALRTTFAISGERPVQRVHEYMEVRFSEEDATTWSEEFLHHCLSGEAYRPFDLERGPLLRLQLFSRGKNEYIFLLVVHHIIADFWSLVIFVHELEILYQAAKAGSPSPLPPLESQFTDFVRWQSEILGQQEGEQLWTYWKQQLSGTLTPLHLPIDRRRPVWQSYRGASQPLKIGAEITERLKALSHETDTTLFTTLLTTLYVMLYHYTDQEDLIVGSPMTGRSRSAWLNTIGHFVNPVVLRSSLAENPPFLTLIERVKQTVQGALEHQDYPFTLLLERRQPQRDLGRLPFPQVMFVWKKAHRLNGADLTPLALGTESSQVTVGGLPLEAIPLEFVPLEQHVSQCDLTLTIGEVDGALSGSLQYNTSLFDPATIAQMRQHYQTLLDAIVANPTQRLATILLALDQN